MFPSGKKARTQSSAGKLMATTFWDMQGVILIEYMAQKAAYSYCPKTSISVTWKCAPSSW